MAGSIWMLSYTARSLHAGVSGMGPRAAETPVWDPLILRSSRMSHSEERTEVNLTA